MNYFDLTTLLAPEIIVVVGALLTLFSDAGLPRTLSPSLRATIVAGLAAISAAIALAWMFAIPQQGDTLEGILSVSPLTQFAKQVILGLGIFHILSAVGQKFTRHAGEYFALLLLATSGMMLLVSSNNLLMLFVSLELVSLSLYTLAAFAKDRKTSVEAGFKYFLYGGMSAAFMLFGFSFLYGITGELDLVKIGYKLSDKVYEPAFYLALIMTVAGLGFKVAAAPFHSWAADVYQGAPIPIASYVASASKVASFFLVARIFLGGLDRAGGDAGWKSFAPGWVPLIAVLAVASMVIGNLAAISQISVKRILAYSAIAHAGYALVALLSNDIRGMESLLYYVITYAITVTGAFAVLGVVESQGGGDKLSDLAGLSGRSPLIAFSMLVFILSLAGIPPLAGFFGKFYVFTAVMKQASESLGLVWIVAIAIGMSAVSFYYYLQILKQVYVAEPVGIMLVNYKVTKFTTAGVVLLAALVIFLGIAPDRIVGRLTELIKLAPL